MSGRTGGDARSQLTWRGLLHAAVPKLTVFYSPGEEVLTNLPENLPPDPGLPADEPQGKYAFSIQAMLKGLETDEPDVSQGAWYMPWENFVGKFGSFVTHAFEGMSPASPHGGWGWDIGHEDPWFVEYISPTTYKGPVRQPEWFHSQLQTPAFGDRLVRDPVFGTSVPVGCQGLFDPANGSSVAAKPPCFRRILSQMIPERTLPAGGAGGKRGAGRNRSPNGASHLCCQTVDR
jgi:hypothetical protein